MKVLLLGSDGYLGWSTALSLLNDVDELILVDNYSKRKYISTKDNRPIPLLIDLLKASKNKYPLFIEIKPNLSKK